jgi:DNA-binding MarR family transcriptional regulator
MRAHANYSSRILYAQAMLPDHDVALDADDELLWRLVGRLVQRLPREIDDEMMRATGLTMTEFAILNALSGHAGAAMRLNELAADTGLSHSRVSRVITALTTRGWCVREHDSGDGRAFLIRLTGTGRAKMDAALPHHNRLARERVIDRIEPAARDTVRAALLAITSDRQ